MQQAIKDISTAIKLENKNAYYYSYRGDMYNYNKQFENAIEDYSQSIRLIPQEPSYYSNRGTAYFNLNKYAESVQDYSRAIKLDPSNSSFYNDRGDVLILMKKYNEAMNDLNKAIKLNPQFAHAYRNRAGVFLATNDVVRARQDLERAKQFNTENDAELASDIALLEQQINEGGAGLVEPVLEAAPSIPQNLWGQKQDKDDADEEVAVEEEPVQEVIEAKKRPISERENEKYVSQKKQKIEAAVPEELASMFEMPDEPKVAVNENTQWKSVLDESIYALCICPICNQLMFNPCIAQDGVTYEREEIEKYFATSKVSPVTNVPITSTTLYPNLMLKTFIIQLLDMNPHLQDRWYFSKKLQKKACNAVVNNNLKELEAIVNVDGRILVRPLLNNVTLLEYICTEGKAAMLEWVIHQRSTRNIPLSIDASKSLVSIVCNNNKMERASALCVKIARLAQWQTRDFSYLKDLAEKFGDKTLSMLVDTILLENDRYYSG